MELLIVGCGYLGQRVARALFRESPKIFATTRSSENDVMLRHMFVRPIRADVLVPESLEDLPEVDAVLYSVGLDRKAGHSMREVYVKGPQNVLRALPGSPHVVHISSTSVYGQTDGEEVDEASATEPKEESGKIVLDAERVVRELRPDATILRFAGIYGPGRLLRSADLRAGAPLRINTEKWLNLIHVDDGVEAVIAALKMPQKGQTFNVSDGHPVRRRDFYHEVARLIQAPTPRFEPEPAPSASEPNRRILNRRMREVLRVQLRYPLYTDGLAASI